MCNAWNHRDDCQCNFRGGRRTSRRPKPAQWSGKSYGRYLSQNHQTCPKCGADVFFIRFGGGGGGFFNKLGRPWTKHACLIITQAYTPFTPKRVPKLTARKSEYESDGWSPLFNVQTNADMLETIIAGSSLAGPALVRFSYSGIVTFDSTAPTYFRLERDNIGLAQIDYFDAQTSEPTSIIAKCLPERRS